MKPSRKSRKKSKKTRTPKHRSQRVSWRDRLQALRSRWHWAVLIAGPVLFLFAGVWTYLQVSPAFSTRPGQMVGWAGKHSLLLIVRDLPWWFLVVCAGIVVYLWRKHRFLMSLVIGMIAAVWWVL